MGSMIPLRFHYIETASRCTEVRRLFRITTPLGDIINKNLLALHNAPALLAPQLHPRLMPFAL